MNLSINNEIAYESVVIPNYYVTKTGKIYSTYVKGGQGRIDITQPHELSYGTDKDGYLRVVLSKNKNKTYIKVHTLIVEQFLGHINEGFVVNHIDGNKQNNKVDNLEITTIKENTIHAHKHYLCKNDYPVKVEYQNDTYIFGSIAECCRNISDLSPYYVKQIRDKVMQFSMIEFKKVNEKARISPINAIYNGKLYKQFPNMISADEYFNVSRGTVSSTMKAVHRKIVNQYHITFPNVSTIENTILIGSE